jgi:two-component system response regulator RegX3
MAKKPNSERRIKVLVVEDEESFIDALSIGLDREGFDVAIARDGHQAMSVF